MLWTYLNGKKELEAENIASLLREKNYDKYKNAKFKILDDMVVLYNNDEVVNKKFLDEKNYVVLDNDLIISETEYLKMIYKQTLTFIFNDLGIKLLSDKYKDNFKPVVKGNFDSRGGLILEGKKYKIIISLNYMDLYDVVILKNEMIIEQYDDLFFDELSKVLSL